MLGLSRHATDTRFEADPLTGNFRYALLSNVRQQTKIKPHIRHDHYTLIKMYKKRCVECFKFGLKINLKRGRIQEE